MPDRNVRISREADLVLENLKLKARQRHHKTVYKGNILNWLITQCMDINEVQRQFEEWLKKDC
jgi:hypothetical protein